MIWPYVILFASTCGAAKETTCIRRSWLFQNPNHRGNTWPLSILMKSRQNAQIDTPWPIPPFVGKEWALRGACKSYTYNVSKCCEPWNRLLFWKHEKNFSLVSFASFGDFVLRPYPCLRPSCSCSAQLPMDKVVRVPIHKSIRQMTQFIAMTRLCVFGWTGWTGWVDYNLLHAVVCGLKDSMILRESLLGSPASFLLAPASSIAASAGICSQWPTWDKHWCQFMVLCWRPRSCLLFGHSCKRDECELAWEFIARAWSSWYVVGNE